MTTEVLERQDEVATRDDESGREQSFHDMNGPQLLMAVEQMGQRLGSFDGDGDYSLIFALMAKQSAMLWEQALSTAFQAGRQAAALELMHSNQRVAEGAIAVSNGIRHLAAISEK